MTGRMRGDDPRPSERQFRPLRATSSPHEVWGSRGDGDGCRRVIAGGRRVVARAIALGVRESSSLYVVQSSKRDGWITRDVNDPTNHRRRRRRGARIPGPIAHVCPSFPIWIIHCSELPSSRPSCPRPSSISRRSLVLPSRPI